MARRNIYRTGFTAVELLIVLAIVSMLAALAASAVFRVRATSERTATETTLKKLASALDVHWKAVVDAARKEYDALPTNIKANLLALADNVSAAPNLPKPHPRRDDRARLLYIKFRLKQEFPTSFSIALNPAVFGATQFLPLSAVPNTGNPGTWTGKPAYVKAIYNKNLDPELQSSALLVLALQQPRSGVPTVGIDQLVGSNFMRNVDGFDYVVDSWGNPLQFFAFPAYPEGQGPSTTDLDVGPYTVSNRPNDSLADKTKNQVIDPQDPELLLVIDPSSNQQWNQTTIPPRLMPSVLHPQLPNPPKGNFVLLRKMIPIIVSAGPDQSLSIPDRKVYDPTKPNNPDVAALNPFMSLRLDGSFDNIYSFRLRQTGARGD